MHPFTEIRRQNLPIYQGIWHDYLTNIIPGQGLEIHMY